MTLSAHPIPLFTMEVDSSSNGGSEQSKNIVAEYCKRHGIIVPPDSVIVLATPRGDSLRLCVSKQTASFAQQVYRAISISGYSLRLQSDDMSDSLSSMEITYLPESYKSSAQGGCRWSVCIYIYWHENDEWVPDFRCKFTSVNIVSDFFDKT